MDKSTRARQPSQVLAVLGLPVLYFVIVPLYMITFSAQDLVHLDRSLTVKIALINTVTLQVVLLTGLFAVRLLKIQKFYTSVLYFLLFWVVLAGFLLPVIDKATLVDPADTVIKPTAIVLTALLSVGLTYTIHTRFRLIASAFCIVLVVSPLLLGAGRIRGYFTPSERGNVARLSREQNVLILSFDGLPGQISLELIDNDPRLSDRFSDFVVFSNVASSMSTTIPSIMSELFGPINLKEIAPTEHSLHGKLRKDEVLINDPGYDSFAYGSYLHFATDESIRIPKGGIASEPSKMNQAIAVYDSLDFVTVRIGGPPLLRAINFIDHATSFRDLVLMLLGVQDSKNTGLSARITNHTGTAWDKEMVLTVNDLNQFIDDLEVDTDRPCLRHMHFTFTHFPVDFDSDLEYGSDDYNWHLANQNEQGARAETLGTLKRIADLLDRLESIGAYENAFIVIKSDHGKPTWFYDTPPDNTIINDHKYWGYGRYRPLLMIKEEHRRREESEFVDRLVPLDDLAITLRARYSTTSGNLDLPGIDLLDPRQDSSQGFYLYLPENPESDATLDSHYAVPVSRNEDLFEQLKKNPNVKISE